MLFDRWCAACKTEDLTSVPELMSLEEFKNGVPHRTAVYLNGQKVTTLQQTSLSHTMILLSVNSLAAT